MGAIVGWSFYVCVCKWIRSDSNDARDFQSKTIALSLNPLETGALKLSDGPIKSLGPRNYIRLKECESRSANHSGTEEQKANDL